MNLALLSSFVSFITQVLTFAIFLRVLLSWVPLSPRNPFTKLLYQVTEPILAPIRMVLPRLGVLDLSPVVAIIILQVIGRILVQGR